MFAKRGSKRDGAFICKLKCGWLNMFKVSIAMFNYSARICFRVKIRIANYGRFIGKL